MLLVSEAAVESFAVACVSREYLLHHRVCPDKVDSNGALIIAVGPSAFLEAIPELADIYERAVITRGKIGVRSCTTQTPRIRPDTPNAIASHRRT